GELVDGEGRRVLNNGEGPIAIPEGVSSVSVNSEGDVVADGQNLARLAVVNPDELGLVREGLNLFRAENGYTPSQDFKVLQGAVEGSNVDSMTEFVRLIEVQRMYEGTKGFLDKEAERLQGFVDTVRRTE
ncbi:MAG: flagellar basal body rod C-terminal domain-containing protein, partial [Pseudomonadota bacterium]